MSGMRIVVARRGALPWYRQFWPWFLIALPAASVVFSVATLVVAVRNADSVVRDDWYKGGLAINVDMARDRAAAAAGVVATLTIDGAGRTVEVRLDGAAAPALDVALHHPTQAARDRAVRLTRDADGAYRATLDEPLAGRWHVEVSDPDAGWRLAQPLWLAAGTRARLAPTAS
jgi:hypothetical protein